MGKINNSLGRLRRAGLYSTALTAFTLVGSAALAQTAPAAGSLPGNFTATTGTTDSYQLTSGSTKSATIAIAGANGGSAVALDFNPSASGSGVIKLGGSGALPAGVTQNPGLSIGAGATVNVSGSNVTALLLNDSSGNPSQIYGTLNASGVGPVFVANANGIVVGSTGSITVPGNLGLIGFAQDPSSFSGSINVTTATRGSGAVTIMNGATLTPTSSDSTVLVAGNGAINIGAALPGSGSDSYQVVAGKAFSFDGASVSASSTPLTGSTAAVTLSGGTTNAPITVAALYAAGSVTNNGLATLADAGSGDMLGAFVNNGQVAVNGLKAGSITNNGMITDSGSGTSTFNATGIGAATSGADIVNNGVINESAGSLIFQAGYSGSATGNFTNNGTIAFTTAPSTPTDSLQVNAENILFNGAVTAAPSGGGTSTPTPTPLSAANALQTFQLNAGYFSGSGSAPAGVVDYNSTVYANAIQLAGQADRILGGGLYGAASSGSASIYYGTGNAADPFTQKALAYNFSVFKGATVQADLVTLAGLDANASQDDVGTLNLVGTVGVTPDATGSSNGIGVTAQTINGSGGFTLNDGNTLELAFSGNVNNPYGAAAQGSTDFRYNYLPVSVAATSAGAPGTANVVLLPSLTGSAPQLVNLLVQGNVAVSGMPSNPATHASTSVPFSASTPASVVVAQPSAPNNHLVLQATGNIYTDAIYDPSQNPSIVSGPGFYWPGVMRLATVASASTPDMLSATNGITLEGELNNTLPIASTGGTGIFLKTNNLNLNGNNVVTNAKSWVNFATPQIASAYATTMATSFWQVTPTSYNASLLTLQQLPASAFQASP